MEAEAEAEEKAEAETEAEAEVGAEAEAEVVEEVEEEEVALACVGRILVKTVAVAKRKVEETDITVDAPRDSL